MPQSKQISKKKKSKAGIFNFAFLVMVRRYFLRLAYNGSHFHGWQIQDGVRTVQGAMNEAITNILAESVYVVGAGRTDAGVHARCMYCHFDSSKGEEELKSLPARLNRYFDDSIVFYEILPVLPHAHARYSAISREYQYFLHFQKDPFIARFSYYLHRCPDIDLMNEAAALLMKYNDFRSFCAADSHNAHFLCNILKAEWQWIDKNRMVFTIKANRFLRNMVRIIVGTLIEVGWKKINQTQWQQIIESGDRTMAAATAPPHALFLTDISYPADIFLPQTEKNA